MTTTVAGCYQYTPVPLASVTPNESVHVRITESAAQRLVKEFGTYTTELEGQVGREGADSVSVAVTIAREYRGVMLESTQQTLFLGTPEVLEVRRRKLSRSRTTLVTVGALVGFGALVAAVVQISDPNPNSDDTTPPPPPGARYPVTIFRIPIP